MERLEVDIWEGGDVGRISILCPIAVIGKGHWVLTALFAMYQDCKRNLSFVVPGTRYSAFS